MSSGLEMGRGEGKVERYPLEKRGLWASQKDVSSGLICACMIVSSGVCRGGSV